MNFIESVRRGWDALFLEAATPTQIAAGFAIGTFVALLPTFGFSVLLVFVLLFIFPNINKPAALAALAVWNPLVQIPLYSISFEIGSMFFDGMPVVRYEVEILNQFYTLTRRLIVGNIILASLISTISYGVLYVIFLRYLPKPQLH